MSPANACVSQMAQMISSPGVDVFISRLDVGSSMFDVRLAGVAEAEGFAADARGGLGAALETLFAVAVEDDDGIEIIGAEEMGEEMWDAG